MAKYELEQSIQKRVLVAIGNLPDFRCAVIKTGALKDDRGRLIRYGVLGCADVCGVLLPWGHLCCFELKTLRPGSKQRDEQIAFERVVKEMGASYYVIRSPEEALAALDEIRKKQTLRFPPDVL